MGCVQPGRSDGVRQGEWVLGHGRERRGGGVVWPDVVCAAARRGGECTAQGEDGEEFGVVMGNWLRRAMRCGGPLWMEGRWPHVTTDLAGGVDEHKG